MLSNALALRVPLAPLMITPGTEPTRRGLSRISSTAWSHTPRPFALLWIFLGVWPAGAQSSRPVKLIEYPQKIVTFHSPEDSRIPAALRASGQPVLEVKATDGAAWSGSSKGLVRRQPGTRAEDRTQYFSGRRYLPDDGVQRLAPDNSAGVWVQTRTGVSHIAMVGMSLARKAAHFEDRVRLRHDRYGLVASSMLRTPGDLSTNQLDPSDNDGLWTAMYAAGECFRYAATGSADALARARRSVEAVLFLEEVTGRAGYPARSYPQRRLAWERGNLALDTGWGEGMEGRYEFG